MTATTAISSEVRLKPRKALPFFSHHPWVFQSAVMESPSDLAAGAEVVLRSAEGQFVAKGLYNPHSNIRVRLYSWTEDTALDAPFWAQRLDEAVALRRRLFGAFTSDTACRLVYSEADQLSGLIIDRYGEWLVVQFTALAMAQRQEMWLDLLQERLQPRGIIIRTEKGIRDAEGLEIADGLIRGEAPPRPMFVTENGVRYGVDLTEGQKTGFFLDQRDNRQRLNALVENARVLDMFCYSGGFGLNALVNGRAAEVIAVDGSDGAVNLAKCNAELNGVAERFHVTKEDGFKALERLAGEGERFDVIVLDPPKLARRREALDAALRGYFSLNRLAVDLLNPGGLLMTCSCSGVVTHQHFVETLSRVGLDAGRHIQILEARGPSADHPASIHCLESDYLKCYLCRVV
ncbi:MAG TPA: class I SAM-dependent rRNA methyltransferase [Planctomycetaceae bacterium]|nr:class I SAM-dependent rRNA methyltransferase [Planctomycetaceae bacterium]